MPSESAPDFLGIIRRFARAKADVVLVGGVAAIVHGSPLMTEDVDLVYRATSGNIRRILLEIETLEARYRDPAGRVIVPTEERLATQKVNLLTTVAGALDLLIEIGDGWDYEALVPRSSMYQLGDFEARVINLDALIESKRCAGRPKDLSALPLLEHLLHCQKG